MFFKEWFDTPVRLADKEKMQKEYNDICKQVSSFPKRRAKLEEDWQKIRRQQLRMSAELSKA